MLPFEDPDPSLIPWAGRRALDRAGLKLSLRAWQGLSLPVRATLMAIGEAADVEASRVAALLEHADPAPRAIAPVPDPPADRVPAEVREALGAARPLDDRAWRALGAPARFALAAYARRGRHERLAEAYDALRSTRRS